MAFDPMAAAVDWLDAYRAGDIDTIPNMYADNAMIHCGWGGMKTIAGKEGLRAYWVDRLHTNPTSELDNLQPHVDGTTISYVTAGDVVIAVIGFDASLGKIKTLTCGPQRSVKIACQRSR